MSTKACGQCERPVDIPDDIEPLVSGLGTPLCRKCLDEIMSANQGIPRPVVEPRPSKYVFTDDMDEISGFGGGYEQTCRNMVVAGLEWFDSHPNAAPLYKGFQRIYGVISEENAAAKLLSKAIVAGADGDCTGAMHQATVSHVLWIKTNGWERYCRESRERVKAEAEHGH